MIKTLKDLQLNDFYRIFAIIQELVKNGKTFASDQIFMLNKISMILGVKYTGFILTEVDGNKLARAYQLYVKDNRPQCWVSPLSNCIGFKFNVSWNEKDVLIIFRSLEKQLLDNGLIKGKDVIIPHSLIKKAIGELPYHSRKQLGSGSITARLKQAFCIWYFNKRSEVWKIKAPINTYENATLEQREKLEFILKHISPEKLRLIRSSPSRTGQNKTPSELMRRHCDTQGPLQNGLETTLTVIDSMNKLKSNLPSFNKSALVVLMPALPLKLASAKANYSTVSYGSVKTTVIPLTRVIVPVVKMEIVDGMKLRSWVEKEVRRCLDLMLK